jgi:hypothetical protein
VEVWVEKDAIAGIVADNANSFGVPVFVCRGFASLSSLFSAAETFKQAIREGKEVVIYHFGDYDPSGVAAFEAIAKTMRTDFGLDITFVRAAVTPEQIAELGLPTRPTKESAHSKKWNGGESVELDAMHPDTLRGLVESCITRHIDDRQWKIEEKIELGERSQLTAIWRKLSRKSHYENRH